MATVFAAAAGPGCVPCEAGEIIDQVVASIGNHAITRYDLEQDYRFERFLNGQSPEAAPDSATLARIRDRLINQRLLAMETVGENSDSENGQEDIAAELTQLEKRFPSEEAFRSSLNSLGLSREQIRAKFAERQRILQKIDRRLRPLAWVEDSEVEAYYREIFILEFRQRSSEQVPPLGEVETQIREILVQKKIDQLLETWLEELKSRQKVRIHPL